MSWRAAPSRFEIAGYDHFPQIKHSLTIKKPFDEWDFAFVLPEPHQIVPVGDYNCHPISVIDIGIVIQQEILDNWAVTTYSIGLCPTGFKEFGQICKQVMLHSARYLWSRLEPTASQSEYSQPRRERKKIRHSSLFFLSNAFLFTKRKEEKNHFQEPSPRQTEQCISYYMHSAIPLISMWSVKYGPLPMVTFQYKVILMRNRHSQFF